MFPARAVPQDKTVLEVKNLTGANGAFNDVSFSVKAGEILGIAGLVGAGRTELVRAIAGADAIRAGEIRMNGEKLSLKSPADAIARGIVMVPEDRKLQGVVVAHKIDENLVYANLDRFGNGWITPSKKRSFADKAIRAFGVKGRGEQLASDLSGGNQQKVVIAKWLTRDPKVVVLDEPTRGIDVGARAGIYDIIANLARGGRRRHRRQLRPRRSARRFQPHPRARAGQAGWHARPRTGKRRLGHGTGHHLII